MSDKTGQREWFSERVKRAKGGETHEIVFDAALRAAIEPEINKSREARDKVFSRAPPALTHALNAAGFKRLAAEKQFAFDTVAHPLQPALAHLLGCGVPLDRLHDLFSGDCGRKGARSEKLALMAPLADSARRGEFCAIFRAFVLEAIAPHVAEETGEDTLVFQSFPCVRVNRPGEFSIGPHTDAQYGHGPGNINFYVPLTKIWGTNSLFLESSPGAQNWHPIEAAYGEIKRFWGGACTHFTLENETSFTRVSLDFRCMPWPLFDLQRRLLPDHYAEPKSSYYFVVSRSRSPDLSPETVASGQDWPPHRPDDSGVEEISASGGDPARAFSVVGEVGEPDWRMGFPFTELKETVQAPR